MSNWFFDGMKARYPEGEWALFFELCRSTGGYTRSADAVAFNLWPSRGYAIHGFEMKQHRSDWLRELKTPEKADTIARFCDYWWLVTVNGEIAKADELPDKWGHLVLRGGKLVAARAAKKLPPPKKMDSAFMASMLRRIQEQYVHRSTIPTPEQLSEQVKQQIEEARLEWKPRYDEVCRQYDGLTKWLQKITGIEYYSHTQCRIETLLRLAVSLINAGLPGDFIEVMRRNHIEMNNLSLRSLHALERALLFSKQHSLAYGSLTCECGHTLDMHHFGGGPGSHLISCGGDGGKCRCTNWVDKDGKTLVDWKSPTPLPEGEAEIDEMDDTESEEDDA